MYILKTVSVLAMLSALPGAVSAQTTSDEAEKRLDPIVTTATHRAQLLSEIPASVSVLEGNTLGLADAYNSASDISDLTTGIEAAVANGTQVAFQIRGIGAVDHQALTPTAAAVYSDGVYLATNVQSGLMMYDLARIEVLKGPQGTLYGRNASGGAVNFVSAKPGESAPGYVSGGYGNFNRFDLSAASDAVISDTMSVRLAGRYLSRDAALDNVGGPDAAGGERDEFGLRANLLWNVTPTAELLLAAHYEEDNGVNAAPRNDSLDLSDHEISVAGDGLQDTDNEFFGISARYERTLGRWALESLTALEGYNQQYGFDFDGTTAPFGVESLNANLSYDRDFLQISQEFQIQTDWDGGQSLIGLMGAVEDFSQVYTVWCGTLDVQTMLGTCRYVGAPGRAGPTPASLGTATTLVSEIEQTRGTLALFTYNEIDLAPRWTATLGARFTHERIEGEGQGRHIFDDGTVAFNNRDGLGAAIGGNAIDENRLSGNIALRYDLGAGAAYASIANSYKSGGYNGEIPNNVTHFAEEGLFEAETVTAYELGYKGTPTENMSYNVAVFYQDYDAPQARIFVNFPLPDGTSITSNSLSNLDAAVSYGLEADFAWSPVYGLDLNAGLTLLDTEIEQRSDVGGNAAAFDGNPLPFAPETSAVLGGRYEWNAWENTRAAVQLHAKYRDAYFLDTEGLASRSQDAFTTVQAEASLFFDARDLELTLWGRNLTDEDYAVSGFGFIGYNTFRSDPATYGLRLTKGF